MTFELDGNKGHFFYQCRKCFENNELNFVKVKFDDKGIVCSCSEHDSKIEVGFGPKDA